MSGTELKITEHLSKSGKPHNDYITTNDYLPLDTQLKIIVLRLQEKYHIFGKLLDSDLSKILDSKIEIVKIKGERYIKIKER